MTDRQGRAAAASLVTVGAVLLAAGCAPGNTEPGSTEPGSTPAATTAGLRAAAAKYLAIAQPANCELDHEFGGFGDRLKDGELAAARADLRAVAAAGALSLRELHGYSGRWRPPTSRWKTRSGSSAASSGCRRPIPADGGKPAVN